MNKVMAAAGRREVRDIVDLMTVNDILPLGAVIWAAVEKIAGIYAGGTHCRNSPELPLSRRRMACSRDHGTD